MKYKYEYETIKIETNGYGLIHGKVYEMEFDHRKIIQKRAEDGWRYVGHIPTMQRGTGHIEKMDLVFEKELASKE